MSTVVPNYNMFYAEVRHEADYDNYGFTSFGWVVTSGWLFRVPAGSRDTDATVVNLRANVVV